MELFGRRMLGTARRIAQCNIGTCWKQGRNSIGAKSQKRLRSVADESKPRRSRIAAHNEGKHDMHERRKESATRPRSMWSCRSACPRISFGREPASHDLCFGGFCADLRAVDLPSSTPCLAPSGGPMGCGDPYPVGCGDFMRCGDPTAGAGTRRGTRPSLGYVLLRRCEQRQRLDRVHRRWVDGGETTVSGGISTRFLALTCRGTNRRRLR